MLEYKRVHGHCEVPQKEGMLGMWVANQRKAKKSDSLSQDRVDRLNSTGFTWKVQVGKTKLLPEWKRSKEDLIKWDEKLAAVAAGGILSDHQKKWLQEQKQLDMDCKLGDYKSKQLRLLLSKDHKTECAAESAAECVTDCAAECVTECVAESNSEAIEFLNNLGQNDYVEV
ncbi:hypothetical protein THAOC_03310 [Thalassiosira oceanica]|uniref:Helicase-associated domain-containing protein n=1 Tax=Thalassiosira oceanica TaxID=159749 RepID=K0TPW0_THAOC|nr:hypothetical protein THAOC_03310 [Thalassiosira oceanica]|eukprot:EJK74982.1 hypothetical protein THAOC_03310 [Thalassiosira oceanica]